MDWKTLLAYILGSADEELLIRNAYLAAEKSDDPDWDTFQASMQAYREEFDRKLPEA